MQAVCPWGAWLAAVAIATGGAAFFCFGPDPVRASAPGPGPEAAQLRRRRFSLLTIRSVSTRKQVGNGELVSQWRLWCPSLCSRYFFLTLLPASDTNGAWSGGKWFKRVKNGVLFILIRMGHEERCATVSESFGA